MLPGSSYIKGDVMPKYGYEDTTHVGIAIIGDVQVRPGPFIHASSASLNDYLEDGCDPVVLFVGVVNVAGLLLARIEELTGRDPAEELRHIAAHINEEE